MMIWTMQPAWWEMHYAEIHLCVSTEMWWRVFFSWLPGVVVERILACLCWSSWSKQVYQSRSASATLCDEVTSLAPTLATQGLMFAGQFGISPCEREATR